MSSETYCLIYQHPLSQKTPKSLELYVTLYKTPTSIVLVTIYSKLDQADISAEQIRRILKEFDEHFA